MKRQIQKLFTLLLALLLVLQIIGTASAAFDDFSDVHGHWAESALRQGFQDELLVGFDDSTMGPDRVITAAQMLTILCRVLDAQDVADTSSLGLSGDEWYALPAAKAAALGLITNGVSLNAPMTRLDAMVMMARAFQLIQADPDLSRLCAYQDTAGLSGENKRAIASLVNAGYIIGYDGILDLTGSITRAQFLTILYRVIGQFCPGGAATESGGTYIFSGSGDLFSRTFQNVWFDCTASSIFLSNVRAETLTIRSQALRYLAITALTDIDRLVLASNGDLTLAPANSSTIKTLVAGDGKGKLAIANGIQNLEITGSNRVVSLTPSVDSIVISGDNNTLTLNYGCRAASVRVTGKNNTIILNGSAASIEVSGRDATISGSGSAAEIETTAINCSVTVSCGSFLDNSDKGLYGVSLQLSAPAALPTGEVLQVSAAVSGAQEGRSFTGTWYLDGTAMDTVTTGNGTVDFHHTFTYTKDMAAESQVTFILTYTTEQGEEQTLSESAVVAIENYPESHYDDINRILSMVSSEYRGDYTLKWAETHDYADYEKETWVNARAYSSTSNYLIWINRAYQRVNIFEGSGGNWKLIRECIVGTGANGSPTPVGVYTVTYKQTGWFTSSYTVYPVVRFRLGSGLAFHSRLYAPGSRTILNDARIGFPVSHGCIRMYNEDVQWIYDHIPSGTTVVVY